MDLCGRRGHLLSQAPFGQTLAAARIRFPALANGVAQSGAGSWQIVRNLTCAHFYNDGFNIHGAQRHQIFENIAAIECGDDGFSAHEDAHCQVRGFTSIGNATGLCDTGSSVTHYRDLFIRDCGGYDIYFIGDSPHSVENALIESRAARPWRSPGTPTGRRTAPARPACATSAWSTSGNLPAPSASAA